MREEGKVHRKEWKGGWEEERKECRKESTRNKEKGCRQRRKDRRIKGRNDAGTHEA